MYECSNYIHNRYIPLPSLGCGMKDPVHNGSIVLTPLSVLRFSRKNSFDAVSRPGCVLQETLGSPVGVGCGNAGEARSSMQSPRSSRHLRSPRCRKGGDAKPPYCYVRAATATKAACTCSST